MWTFTASVGCNPSKKTWLFLSSQTCPSLLHKIPFPPSLGDETSQQGMLGSAKPVLWSIHVIYMISKINCIYTILEREDKIGDVSNVTCMMSHPPN